MVSVPPHMRPLAVALVTGIVGIAGCGDADEQDAATAKTVVVSPSAPPATSAVSTTAELSSTVPRPPTFRTVAGVLQPADEPASITFGVLDSYPPQLGHGVPLSNWDWELVDGEQSAQGTVWTEQTFEFVGTWDGEVFTLMQPPRPAEVTEKDYSTPTAGCDPRRWLKLLDELDYTELGIIWSSDDAWDGRCGVQVHALVDTPELRRALTPLGEAATVTFALERISRLADQTLVAARHPREGPARIRLAHLGTSCRWRERHLNDAPSVESSGPFALAFCQSWLSKIELSLDAIVRRAVNEEDHMQQVAVVAHVRVQEGKSDEFLAAVTPLLEQAEKEPGTLLYIVQRSKNDPHVFWTSEVYTDGAAFEAHSESEVHAAAAPVFTELIVESEVTVGEVLMGKGLTG